MSEEIINRFIEDLANNYFAAINDMGRINTDLCVSDFLKNIVPDQFHIYRHLLISYYSPMLKLLSTVKCSIIDSLKSIVSCVILVSSNFL